MSAGTKARGRPPRGAVERFLKALTQADGAAVIEADHTVTIPVRAGGIRRRVRFAADILAEALSAGSVARDANGIALTDAGQAHVRRAAATADPFVAQHGDISPATITTPNGPAQVMADAAESPLAWLRRRRGPGGEPLLTEAAFQAGERLRADFTRGSMMPRVTANWEATVSSGMRADPGTALSDSTIAARQRVGRAVDAVGPELAGVLIDVCCHLKGLEHVEAERQWPARSAKVVLGLALDRLATHYGIAERASGPERSGAIRAWSTPDARGSIADRTIG